VRVAVRVAAHVAECVAVKISLVDEYRYGKRISLWYA